MKKTQFKGAAMLLLAAFIWGSAFVAQSVGMESVDAFTFNGIRSLMGSAILIPVILVKDAVGAKKPGAVSKEEKKKTDKSSVLCGALLGVILCVATNLQQFAFYDSPSGKIAFITAFYMFFVPLLGLIGGKRVPLLTWCCVALGTVGLYFLCIGSEGFSGVNRGDLLALGCAVVFAVHILLVEKFSAGLDGIKLSCTQFAVSGVLSCILMFIFETPSLTAINSCLPSILYAGIMSSGVAYTLQIVGQKYTESTVASLLLCTESLFGVICSAILLHQQLLPREYVGCAVMFAAIVLSQVSEPLTEKLKARKNSPSQINGK